MMWSSAQMLRLCLVTGQRLGEVTGARKSELKLPERGDGLAGACVWHRQSRIEGLV